MLSTRDHCISDEFFCSYCSKAHVTSHAGQFLKNSCPRLTKRRRFVAIILLIYDTPDSLKNPASGITMVTRWWDSALYRMERLVENGPVPLGKDGNSTPFSRSDFRHRM